MNKNNIIFLVLATGLLIISIILGWKNIDLQHKIKNLKILLEQQKIDTTPSSNYFINAYNAYNNSDWTGVTTNTKAYENKLLQIKEPINYTVYLYSSYSYYKLYIKLIEVAGATNKDYELLEKGLIDIDKYIAENKDKSMAYFIKGLLLIEFDKDDIKYIENLNKAYNNFKKSLTRVKDENSNQTKNIMYHMGFAKYKLGLIYKAKGDNNNAVKSFNDALEILTKSNYSKSNNLIKSIPILIKQCK